MRDELARLLVSAQEIGALPLWEKQKRVAEIGGAALSLLGRMVDKIETLEREVHELRNRKPQVPVRR